MKATDEQKSIAKKLKIKHSPNINADTLQRRIDAQPVAYKNDAMKHVSQQAVAAVYENTPEEVDEAIAKYIKDGFKATYPGDGTWHFSYRGREECGNLAIPLRVIVMKAQNVAKGPLVLRAMGKDNTYKGYADTILAG
jgi:hypothetical protein